MNFIEILTCSIFLLQGSMASSHELDSNYTFDLSPCHHMTFPGGDSAFKKFLEKHLVFPPSMLKDSIEGRVIIRFTIDSTGHLVKPEILRVYIFQQGNTSYTLDANQPFAKEAVRVLGLVPEWPLCRYKGKAQSYQMLYPVSFRLD